MKFFKLFRDFEKSFNERFGRSVWPYCSGYFYGVIISDATLTSPVIKYVEEYFGVDNYVVEKFKGCMAIEFPHELIDGKNEKI